MTAHTRRNRRNRTEIDIATKYFEEEKEKTKELLARKKQNLSPKISRERKKIRPSSKPTHIKKKKEIQPRKGNRNIPFQKNQDKKDLQSPTKKKNPIRKRAVMKKSQNSKNRISKRSRTQYFHRFKI
jgi:hypothetical protein